MATTARETIGKFLMDSPGQEISTSDTTEDIGKQIVLTRQAISAVYTAFNNTYDDDIMEACIYEIKSLEAQHRALIKKLKRG